MIIIRPSQSVDIANLADFQMRLADETENVLLEEGVVLSGLKALFDDPAKGIYFVAERDDKIIGCFLITYEWSDWRNGMVWWLQSVYILPLHRRQGIFKIMYDHIIQMIHHDENIIGLRLYVDKTNTRAQKVYQAMGMNGDHYTVYEWMRN